jgi:hypothetical protein
MASTPLHPNLAKIAASYDDIIYRFGQGRVSAAAARNEVMTLVARDDEGVQWSINPDTGGWQRRTLSGTLVAGEPPAYGLATATPHDLSDPRAGFRPDSFVELHPVDNELLYSPSQFAGSTRSPDAHNAQSSGWWEDLNDRISPAMVRSVVVLVLVVLIVVGSLFWWQHDHTKVLPTTTTITTPAP